MAGLAASPRVTWLTLVVAGLTLLASAATLVWVLLVDRSDLRLAQLDACAAHRLRIVELVDRGWEPAAIDTYLTDFGDSGDLYDFDFDTDCGPATTRDLATSVRDTHPVGPASDDIDN